MWGAGAGGGGWFFQLQEYLNAVGGVFLGGMLRSPGGPGSSWGMPLLCLVRGDRWPQAVLTADRTRAQLSSAHRCPPPLAPPQRHLEKPAVHKPPLPTPLSLLPVVTTLLQTPLDIRLGGSVSLSQPRFLALKSGSDAKSRADVMLFIAFRSPSRGCPERAKPTSHLSFQL